MNIFSDKEKKRKYSFKKSRAKDSYAETGIDKITGSGERVIPSSNRYFWELVRESVL